MESFRIIYILFLFSYLISGAEEKLVPDNTAVINRYTLDSIFESEYQAEQQKRNAQETIDQYDILLASGVHLEPKDFKRLAESYARLNDAENAVFYLEKYINESFNTNILYSDSFRAIAASSTFTTLTKRYLPRMNFWILFFIFSGIVGIFISLTINLRKKGDRIGNLLIGLFVLFHSLFILHLSLFLTNYFYHVPNSFWLTITFSLLYGPLLYFYFKRIVTNYTFRLIDVLHFLPTLILMVYFVPVYFLPREIKQYKLFNVDESYVTTLYVILILKAISLITYSLLVYNIYRKQNKIKVHREMQLWQRNISYMNILYAFTYGVYAFIIASNVVFDRSKSFMLYSQVFILALIVLYVAYTAYARPKVFSKNYIFDEITAKYQKSGLTDSYSIELKEQLLVFLKDGKVYKDNDINLNSLANKLGTTRHNLSQVINEHFNMNFFNLINRFRIEEAKRLLLDDSYNNFNIIDIAYDVGFNNKVTFNKAFKEATNLTPSQYLRQNRPAVLNVKLR